MALRQIEDAYNNATPLERAKRWPRTDAERRYSRLCCALEAEIANGRADQKMLAAATEEVESQLAQLGVDPTRVA